MTRRVILDVDTGTDDAVAVMMAGLASELDLLGCTTVWGNHEVTTCTTNTLQVLDAIGRSDVPVHQGLGKPFAPVPFLFDAHVDSGRRAVHPDRLPLPVTAREATSSLGVEWLLETLRASTQPVTLVPVAPLSNIAAVVTMDPSVVEAVEEVVVMGGAHAFGNVTSAAEANFWHDPVAADVVLKAGFERLVLVPIDATHRAALGNAHVEQLAAVGTPAAAAAAELIAHRIRGYRESEPQHRPDVAPVHDALCVGYLLDPAVLQLQHLYVEVETTGVRSFGRSLIDTAGRSGRPANAHVALDADADRFADLLQRVLTSPPSNRPPAAGATELTDP